MNFLQPNAVPGAIEAGIDHKTKRINIVHFLRASQVCFDNPIFSVPDKKNN